MKVDLPASQDVRVEFKEIWTEKAQKDLIAFANTLGGHLFFGVTDDGVLKGLSKKEVDQTVRSVLSFCRTGTEPVMVDLISTEIRNTGLGNYLLRVSVQPGEDRPYALKGKRYTGGAYVRDGSMSVTATEEELREMIRDSSPEPWELRLSRQTNLTFEEALAIFTKQNVKFSPAFFLKLGLVNDRGDFTQLGELLSDQNTTKLVVGTFSADTKALVVREFTGSILKQLDAAFDFLIMMNPELIRKTGALANTRKTAWPVDALREALVNCAVHRDYSRSEATKISYFPDRFEFLSYGNIPGRLNVDDILKDGVSKCRNEHLAEIFRRLGWMETYGSGFPMIWREYANSGVVPKLEATRNIFRIILPRFPMEESSSNRERCLVLLKNHDALSMAQIAQMLGVSRTSAYNAVNDLINEKLIEKIGVGRTTKYRSLS